MTLTSPPSVRQLAVWINGGRFERPDEAAVPVTDHGLVAGDGVFEALRATPAGAFAVRRHLDRLSRSAAAMGLPDPDHGLIREGIAAALDGWPLPEAKVRITFTGGEGPLGSGAPYGPPNLIVAVEPRDPTPATTAVVTAPWRRNENGPLTGVKSTSYAENVRGLAYAASCGASEAIFLNTAGDVCEGTGSNIFFVFGGQIVTPPLIAGPLAGITRELLLEWHDIVERNVTPRRPRPPTRCSSPPRSATFRAWSCGTTASFPLPAQSPSSWQRCSGSARSTSSIPKPAHQVCPMARTLGVVVAHPDDDAYGVAAVVALHRTDREFRFFLVHATDGEGGSIAEGSGATPETLGAVRREEDRRAWRTLGLSPYRHEWFGYPDGGLADVPYEELVDRVAGVLGAERPDVVATFGPDGVTGHRTTSRSVERPLTPSCGSPAMVVPGSDVWSTAGFASR